MVLGGGQPPDRGSEGGNRGLDSLGGGGEEPQVEGVGGYGG